MGIFVTDFRGKAFRFSLQSMMLGVGLSYMAVIVEVNLSTVNLLRVFIIKRH